MINPTGKPPTEMNPDIPETLRPQRLSRVFSVNIPDTFEEIYLQQYLQKFRSFSGFIRAMVTKGLRTDGVEIDSQTKEVE